MSSDSLGNSSRLELASRIDHTLLNPGAPRDAVQTLCREAVEWEFASVCVHPCRVEVAVDALMDEEPAVVTVIGFPLGATTTRVKRIEAKQALETGADELDMVMNRGWLKDDEPTRVRQDIEAVLETTADQRVKVIVEATLLNEEQLVQACRLAEEAGADFVKTSTGYAGGGATVEDVRIMRRAVGDRVGVKASGGIRTRRQAEDLLEAGANRIGSSSGIDLLRS